MLAIANVTSALRPYSPAGRTRSAPAFAVGDSLELANRTPASESPIVSDPKLALKTARVGCEPTVRLKVVKDVRQLRLQFEPCAATDVISGVQNKTNDFEATIFGSSATTEPEALAGTFTTPEETAKAAKDKRMLASESKSTTPPKSNGTSSNAMAASETVSTDYIALAPGENEIAIRRSGREQTLRIERR